MAVPVYKQLLISRQKPKYKLSEDRLINMRNLKFFTAAIAAFLCLLCSMAVFAGGVEVETETGELVGDGFIIGESEEASGGRFVTAQTLGNMAAVVTMPSQVEGLPHVKMTFELEEEGRYIVWARKRMPSSSSDSAHVVLDDKFLYFMDGTTPDNTFDWRKVAIIRLEKGTHNIKLYPREPGASTDKFLLTTDATYIPEGFGEVPKVDKILYNNGIGTSFYYLPSVVPPAERPRLLVRKSDLPRIRENLNHPQNKAVYEKLLDYANQSLGDPETNSYNERILSVCLSRAFLYLINGDKEMGRSAAERAAIYMKKSGENVGRTGTDVSRSGGYTIMVLSCVYDWCYDLLTEEEKEMFINGAMDILMVSEYPYPMIFPEGEIAGLNGHEDENLFLRDNLAFSIAVYDEDPFIYNHTMGILTERYFPVRNIIHPSGYMPNGQDYGCYRASMDSFCYAMLEKIGAKGLLTDAIFKLPYQNIYDNRGDGVRMADGDGAGNNGGFGVRGLSNNQFFFFGANMSKDPYIKGYYYHGSESDDYTSNWQNDIHYAFYLIFNDVDVEIGDYTELPLTKYYSYPATAMMARTGWDMGPDSNDVVCFMKTPELYVGGHHHYDAGNFQLYYKGILAMDSGVYESDGYIGADGKAVARSLYGSLHDVRYHKATVAHNCMMVYDPEEASENKFGTADGGQRNIRGDYAGITYASDITSDEFKIGETIGYDYGPDMHEPEYTYLESNLKPAYSDKVSAYTRAFMFLNLDDEETPGALIVYDRIKSSNKNFKKSWLLHSMEEPETGENVTVIRRTEGDYNGRLINNTLLPESVNIKKVGGPGEEYLADGTNWYVFKEDKWNEGGNWRVEISPSKASEQDYFLNVLQVGENDEENIPFEVSYKEIGNYIGVYIKDKVVFMKKDAGVSYKDIIVKAEGEVELSYIIANLKEGRWTAFDKSGKKVASELVCGENGVFYFKAQAGEYIVKWSYENNIPKKDFSTISGVRKNDYKTLFSLYDGYFETDAILAGDTPMVDAESFSERVRKDGMCKVDGEKIEVVIPADEIDKRQEQKISYQLGSKTALLNGEEVTLSEAPFKYNDKYYVPLEYWDKVLSCEIKFNPMTSNITFNVPGYVVEGCNPLIVNYREKEYADIKDVYGSITVMDISYGFASVDSDLSTYWSTGEDGGYMIWELLEPREIDKLELAWFQGSSRYTYFEIHTSGDGVNWQKQFDGQSTGRTSQLDDYKFKNPVNAKYVKIVGHGNSDSNFTSLSEIKIHCVD